MNRRSLALALVVALPLGITAAQAQTTAPDSAAVRDSAAPKKPAGRRQPVTPELARTAFADATARTLLERARIARIAQDSALRAYEARTYQRLTVGLAIRRTGIERLLFRSEHAARVRWSRDAGMWVEPTGRRAVSGLAKEAVVDIDLTAATPIPYFPGRESLWLPSSYVSSAQAEVNEEEMLHPLATGAEAYYRYATGDSVVIRLQDGRRITLRELRITARRPTWRGFVGSFWFDADGGSLVRAVYRMAVEMDIWEKIGEDKRRAIEDLDRIAATDTSEEARRMREALGPEATQKISRIVRGMFSPLRADMSAITVEYTLHEGRFWLPRLQTAEGEAQAGMFRTPVRVEESFRYIGVNGDVSVPRIPTLEEAGFAASDTTWESNLTIGTESPNRGKDTTAAGRLAQLDSVQARALRRAATLRVSADSARVAGDTAQARVLEDRARGQESRARRAAVHFRSCTSDSTHIAGVHTRFGGAVRMAVRTPCDESKLLNSPDLPGSIYDRGDDIFDAAAAEELLASLDLSLQPGWGPQPAKLHTGLDLVRYNRIEGLSVGGSLTKVLGLGYSTQAVARLGTADLVPNGEVGIMRSNGRRALRIGFFHRLGVANDDWGSPLSFGASVANLLYARDEGFYYRTWGAELSGLRDAPGPFGGATLQWRLFAERQRSAGAEPNTQVSVADLFGDTRFARNIDAAELRALGAGGEIARSFGADAVRLRVGTRLRAEAAYTDRADSVGTSGYGRAVLDLTLSRGLGPIAASITGAGGTSAGDLPLQRAFFVGGLQTVRGQFARPDTSAGAGRVGDTFWLGRAELGLNAVGVRPVVFADIGWAGRRDDFAHPGRPLSGAGVGVSFLDRLVRIDVARGIAPERKWRVDMYLDARF